MKHSDFHIGLEFLGPAGFRWRCTDVGTRTIVAVCLDHEDPNWYRGPPYVATEEVFDERELESCHLSEDDAIRAAISDWLGASRHADSIAAIRGAHPRHGGQGALYIVFRRPRER